MFISILMTRGLPGHLSRWIGANVYPECISFSAYGNGPGRGEHHARSDSNWYPERVRQCRSTRDVPSASPRISWAYGMGYSDHRGDGGRRLRRARPALHADPGLDAARARLLAPDAD